MDIAEALHINRKLTKLYLEDNIIGSKRAGSIVEALVFHNVLTILALSNNNIRAAALSNNNIRAAVSAHCVPFLPVLTPMGGGENVVTRATPRHTRLRPNIGCRREMVLRAGVFSPY